MFKKIAFVVCLFAAFSVYAVFIPLQKDGSIRFSGTVPNEPAAPNVNHHPDRMPAGNDIPGTYAPDNGYTLVPVKPDPEPEPEPVVNYPVAEVVEGPACKTPAPKNSDGLGRYHCIKRGFRAAGEQYHNISSKYIAAVAAAAKWSQDSTGSLAPWRCEASIRQSIFSLVSFGYCSTEKGYVFPESGEKGVTRAWFEMDKLRMSKDQYAQIFGVKRGTMASTIDKTAYPGDKTPKRMRKDWGNNFDGTPIGDCPTEILPAKERIRVCRKIAAVCGVSANGCGRGNFENPEHNNGGGDNPGSTTRGNTDGSTTRGGDDGRGDDGGDDGGRQGERTHDNNDGHEGDSQGGQTAGPPGTNK